MIAEPRPDDREPADEAVALARALLERSLAITTRWERGRAARLARLLGDPDGRELVFELTDQVLRIAEPARAARRFADVARAHPAAALGRVDRVALALAASWAPRLPRFVVPLVTRRIAAEAGGVVLPADDSALTRVIARHRRAGFTLNVNPLGEATLSDVDADARLHQLLGLVGRPDVDHVSVKISALVANLDPFAFDASVERVCDRLRSVYRAAASARTFVNLDMEAYRDLELSVAAFTRVLDEPEFEHLDAGIALQAYLPDAHAALARLGAWAAARRSRGGGRTRVRLVKGANLAMERVDAELHGWTPAPYPTKADVDASFKAMLDAALDPAWADALLVGVASHNLFDVAWALVLARRRDAPIELEMLAGMAPAQARAVCAAAGGLLLYAPVVARHEFDASIAYLSRRLDENTQPENFLRAQFDLVPGSPAWAEQERRFRDSVAARHAVRGHRGRRPLPGDDGGERFRNEPDSDPTDPAARGAIRATAVPPVVVDVVAAEAAVDRAVDRAAAAAASWATAVADTRRALLRAVADELRAGRFDALAVMAAETGKTTPEGDPEVSEAIDFAGYAAGPGIELLEQLRADGLDVGPRGVVAVAGPWNFPLAIPAGGVFAAVAAGNAVVLKPAPEARRVAAFLVDRIRRAVDRCGAPPDLVQLVACEDGPVGEHLVTHAGVDTVVLTGSIATAELFLGWRPDLRLFAETSGKNALVITATADLDLALADLARSAFGHAGQKCSAASLAIVEAPLHDDPTFLARLRDVVASWRVGWPSDPAAMIGPLIAPPDGPLRRALTTLEPGESWLVAPHPLDDSGRLWSPGVRIGVQPGSWFHRTECFGPVLGVIRADDLDHAIAIQNDSAFGLTGGIHSLDPAEIDHWLDRVEVGNAYVNRHITGAIVGRQPFGGWKRSSVGPGTKAGGPSYLLQFCRIDDPDVTLDAVERSYAHWWAAWFTGAHELSGLASETDVLRHLPVDRVVVRFGPGSETALARLRLASLVTGVELVESDARESTAADLVACLRPTDRVRLVGPVDQVDELGEVRRHCIARGIWFDTAEPSAHGRVELVRWVREQAIARTRHRHGRLVGPADPPATNFTQD